MLSLSVSERAEGHKAKMVSKKKRRHGNGRSEAEKENDEGRVAAYEQSREQRIKENLERMHKLGILKLSCNLKPTPKPTIIRPKKPLPSSPTSQRRSSRIQTNPTVDYSEKHAKLKVEVINDVKIDVKVCHQCRKKSSTPRTNCCKCKIVQGQFCGHCLLTRYGEDILEAMANPKWVCLVCRDICNCSRCRREKGWKPTGNLYKKGLSLGFKSVADYLIHFQGPDGKIEGVTDTSSDEEEDKKDVMIEKNINDEDDYKSESVDDDNDDDSDYKSEPLDDDDDDDDDDDGFSKEDVQILE